MILVLNNKSRFDKDDFFYYYNGLGSLNNNIILCPSYCYLGMCNGDIVLGAQDVSSTSSLAMTGDITAKQLASFGVKYCIVGHADRCEEYGVLKDKIQRLLEYDIIPILCIGEIRKDSSYDEVIKECREKVDYIFKEIGDQKNKIILSYEPKWAINSDIEFDVDKINSILKNIKNYYGNSLLYGGGVNLNNYKKFDFNVIDGFLLGTLGNDIERLKQIL